MKHILDCKGMNCPLPVVNAKNEVAKLSNGDILVILVDNEIAVQNLQRFASHKGFDVSSQKLQEEEYSVTMKISKTAASAVLSISPSPVPNVAHTIAQTTDAPADTDPYDPAHIQCQPDLRQKGMLVVLSSNTMGNGDSKLGTSLMKAFIFALTKQDQLPETILCYNSGASLTCEGADTLEDLKILESEGVTILTCGTCLDFYGLKDKLAVGGVTNMYDIVERMEQARILVKP